MNDVNTEYFNWLYDLVCKDRFGDNISYRKLLYHLHSKEFRWIIDKDENRAYDGLDLRYRFACEYSDIDNADLYIDGPCSVLEMIIALAIICEESYMDDGAIGDRTQQWFWKMIGNLGLGSMYDWQYDEYIVDDIIERFLDRDYEPNGLGGLFVIRNCNYDLRTVEIWHQFCWYLDSITQ